MTISRSSMYKQLEKGNKKMMRKKGGSIKRMKKGGSVKNSGKIRMMKKGGSVKNAKPMTLAQIKLAAKKKGYKVVKA